MDDSNHTATQALIAANPKACYRTLERKLHRSGLLDAGALDTLAAARPNCGYSCDGEDGPNPDGTYGCPVSGRREP